MRRQEMACHPSEEGRTMADRDNWRWQLALGLGRTVLFVAVLMALATLVDALG